MVEGRGGVLVSLFVFSVALAWYLYPFLVFSKALVWFFCMSFFVFSFMS